MKNGGGALETRISESDYGAYLRGGDFEGASFRIGALIAVFARKSGLNQRLRRNPEMHGGGRSTLNSIAHTGAKFGMPE